MMPGFNWGKAVCPIKGLTGWDSPEQRKRRREMLAKRQAERQNETNSEKSSGEKFLEEFLKVRGEEQERKQDETE